MPAIGYLLGFRERLVDSFDVGLVAVTGDNLDAGVFVEPAAHGRDGAVGQDVYGPTTFEVHKDSSVAVATPEGKIVHPYHPHRVGVGCGCSPRRIRPSGVSGLTTKPSSRASLAPASPPNSKAIAESAASRRPVLRAWAATSGSRSQKILLSQPLFSQKNLRA